MFPSSIPQPGQENYLRINATGAYTVPTPTWHFIGLHAELLVEVVATGTLYTGTWPTNINWVKPDGTLTTSIASYLAVLVGRTSLKATGIDQFLFWTNDGGITIYGKLL